MTKLLFIFLWLQLSHGCHKYLTRTTRKKLNQEGIRRRRGGRSNVGEDYMSTCMNEQEMSNHCAFLSCHHGDRYLPGPMPCSPQFCQCGAHGGAPHPMKCGEGTVFINESCAFPRNNADCRLMQSKAKLLSSALLMCHHNHCTPGPAVTARLNAE